MGAFWNCVMSSEVDVGMFQSADQIQQRIESAYFTQQKTFSEHLITECVPKLERARQVLSALTSEMPDALKASLDKYVATLPKMQTGLESYAEKLKTRGAIKDVDQTIQEVGGAFTADVRRSRWRSRSSWSARSRISTRRRTSRACCEYLADTCKKDAVKFMTGVREKCGGLVQNVTRTPSRSRRRRSRRTPRSSSRRIQRQLQAWEYCAKQSRKGKKVLDLEDFLTAASDYIEARGEVGQDRARRRGAHLGPAARRHEEGAGRSRRRVAARLGWRRPPARGAGYPSRTLRD